MDELARKKKEQECQPKWQGNKTEIALLQFMEMSGADYAQYRDTYTGQGNDGESDLLRFPFTSKRKRMTTEVTYKDPNGGQDNYLMIKGASEIILETCKDVHFWDRGDSGDAI